MMQQQLMTLDHPRWEEFIQRLEGPRGCNFQGEYDDEGELIPVSVKWECAGGEDKPKAVAILRTMPEIDVIASLVFFEQHSGYCDCEIVFNVEMNYQTGGVRDNGLDVSERAANGSR